MTMDLIKTDEFINKLRMIVYALLAVPLIIFILLYLRTDKGDGISPIAGGNMAIFFTAFLAAAGLSSIFASYVIFKKKLKVLREEQMLSKKFDGYYKATIIKFSLFEAALILSIIGLLITGEQLFVAIFVIGIFVFSVESPSIRKLFSHLRLNKNERELFLKQED
jgi:hypothetical protein